MKFLPSFFFFLFGTMQLFAQDTILKYDAVITENLLKNHLSTLASDDYGGRGTSTSGENMAAEYISKEFKKLGLKPININSETPYFQRFHLYNPYKWKSVTIKTSRINFNYLEAFYTVHPFEIVKKTFPFLFVGFGADTDEYSDYKDIDVKDKIVVMLVGAPDNTPESEMDSVWSDYNKTQIAYKKGAKGVILIHTSFNNFAQAKSLVFFKNKYRETQLMNLKANEPTDFGIFYFSPTASRALFGKSIKKLKTQSTESYQSKMLLYKRHKSVINVEAKALPYPSKNVVGVLEGTTQKEECIVVSAHYDHLGTRGKKIFNGADDNASGTTGLLAIARAFATAANAGYRPKRSIVFLACSAEELGLLGSKYYTLHPAIPLEKTTLNVNMDMIGRGNSSEPLKLNVVTSTEAIKDFQNQRLKYFKPKVLLRYSKEFMERSDQYSFYKEGIHFIYYNTGIHGDYHQTTDDSDKIGYKGLKTIVTLAFHTIYYASDSLILK